MINIYNIAVVIVVLLPSNQGRHHIISRGHLKPPLEEPAFFTTDIEPDELDLKQEQQRRLKGGTNSHKMPPPVGPIRDLHLEQEQKRGDSGGQKTFKMPPPHGPIREINPHAPYFDEGRDSCGRNSGSSSRVINGDDATLGEWPWQVRLEFNHHHICGGSLIMAEWVMTAAHCVLNDDPSKFKVILGDIDRKKNEGSEQEFEVKRIIKHRLFSHPVPYENDIALFQLSHQASRGDLVNTACLPEFLEEVPLGKECYITGWGQMFGKGDSATILQQARMPVVSNGACAAKLDTSPNGGLHTDNRTWIVTSKMICAGDAGHTKTSGCFGDSGGPLQCKNTAGQWVVQGIVSWGDPDCSSSNHYTVFTRVSVFRKWIEDMLKDTVNKSDKDS